MKRILSFALALIMVLPLAACGGVTAATMHLKRTEGTVSVSNGYGKSLLPLDNLGLYSGYEVGTESASYAWIDLDDVKLTKLDQNSEISIQKEGKVLEIELKSGSLFFNVTKPLADDETMNISTSTMVVGIRGTCGWVSCQDNSSQVYLLEGKVECAAGDQTAQVNAGEVGILTENEELVVEPFTAEDLPAFVRDEVSPELTDALEETPRPVISETPKPSEPPEPPEPSDAPEFTGYAGDDLTWSLYGDGTLIISGTGSMSNFSRYSAPWYDFRSQIHTLIIEEDVTSIGHYAFDQCSLTSVTIPDSVTSIGDNAFNKCDQLTGVTIPDKVDYIGDNAFSECSSLKNITIPGTVSSIGTEAFYACLSLRSVVISDGVTDIGARAFGWCNNLTDLTLPDSVTGIRSYAFSGCTNLTSVYYSGSKEQWSGINIGSDNDPLYAASIYYNSTGIVASLNWNGHSYFVYDICMPWEEAMAYCERMGGHLATITSQDEQTAINGMLDDSCTKNGYWLGGVRLGNNFVWITGEQMNYTNWSSRQPDNSGNKEDKLMLYNYSGTKHGKWNDLSSEGMDDVIVAHGDLGFIFEWDDETYFGNEPSWQGHRYHVFNNATSWADAEAFCELLGGHLATIGSQEENEFIYQLVTDAGYTDAYFGLTDRGEEDAWYWVTDEPVTYTNWHTDEPNSLNPNENYGMFYSYYPDGTWNDGDFEWNQTGGGPAFICEWDPVDTQPPSDPTE